MHGLIGRMRATPGNRDALASIILEGISGMPGCLRYVVARDATDTDAIWVTEVWDDAEAHAASLQLDSVRTAIAEGRRFIAGMDSRHETRPVGGNGLDR